MMKRKLGNMCIILGAVLVISALFLFLWNDYENDQASSLSQGTVSMLQTYITDRQDKLQELVNLEQGYIGEVEQTSEEESLLGETEEVLQGILDPYDFTMSELELDGELYIGFLTIPSLSLELPIRSDWSMDQLKKSPCRYYGALKTDDLVIMAHNYEAHFKYLKDLDVGDEVYFTDVDGMVTSYQVVTIDVLPSTAVSEVTSGDYDLTLFTCTYNGKSRVAVFCDRI